MEKLFVTGVKMLARISITFPALLCWLTLSGCSHTPPNDALTVSFKPPYNNFRPDGRKFRDIGTRLAVGAGTGALVGTVLVNPAAGAAVGLTAGTMIGLYKHNQHSLLKQIQRQDMQYIAYGDTMTLIVPTDGYYQFNSPKFNDICYEGLNSIIKLLNYYPRSPVYVAAFTDDEGSRYHKKMLSQAQAETMLTFLWAHNIPAQLLHAEGYSDQHDIGDNKLIHGSAYNRRIEIQWFTGLSQPPQPGPYISAMR